MADLNDQILTLVQEYQLKVEKFTEEQLAEAIRQALLSGDFLKYTMSTGGEHRQAVQYIPFQEVQSLRTQLATARADAWGEVIQAIRDVDGLLFLDEENDFSWGMFMDWLEERRPK